jgi:hypothetical protein
MIPGLCQEQDLAWAAGAAAQIAEQHGGAAADSWWAR